MTTVKRTVTINRILI